MGLAKRADAAGGIYHMLNRANGRVNVFAKDADYLAFEGILCDAVDRLKWCIKRGAPFGDETWVESTARKYDLESTLQPRGRPKKIQNA